jgi:hypothetical protein
MTTPGWLLGRALYAMGRHIQAWWNSNPRGPAHKEHPAALFCACAACAWAITDKAPEAFHAGDHGHEIPPELAERIEAARTIRPWGPRPRTPGDRPYFGSLRPCPRRRLPRGRPHKGADPPVRGFPDDTTRRKPDEHVFEPVFVARQPSWTRVTGIRLRTAVSSGASATTAGWPTRGHGHLQGLGRRLPLALETMLEPKKLFINFTGASCSIRSRWPFPGDVHRGDTGGRDPGSGSVAACRDIKDAGYMIAWTISWASPSWPHSWTWPTS